MDISALTFRDETATAIRIDAFRQRQKSVGPVGNRFDRRKKPLIEARQTRRLFGFRIRTLNNKSSVSVAPTEANRRGRYVRRYETSIGRRLIQKPTSAEGPGGGRGSGSRGGQIRQIRFLSQKILAIRRSGSIDERHEPRRFLSLDEFNYCR